MASAIFRTQQILVQTVFFFVQQEFQHLFLEMSGQSGKSRRGAFQMWLSVFKNGEFDMLVDDLSSMGPIK